MVRVFIDILTNRGQQATQTSTHLGLKACNSSIFGYFEKKNTDGFVNMEWKGGLTVEQDIKMITQLCPHLEKVIVVWFARMWSCESLRHR